MNVRFWMTVVAVAVVIPLSLAQGQGGGRGFGQRGGAALLSRADVAIELKLTDAQKSAIAEKLPQRPRGQGGGAGGGAGGGGQADPEAAAKRAAEQLATIKGILDEKQFARYQELDLQRSGASVLTRKDVAAKVGLDEKQIKAITELVAAQREEMRNAFQGGGGGGDRQAMFDERAKMRAANDKKILALLTPAQNKTWEGMLGKAFKFVDAQ